MAFKDVNANSQRASGDPVKLTGLKIGESITGFVLGFRPSKQNPDTMNILMRAENSAETFYVYTAGNVKYVIGDGKVKEGLLTQITRIADKDVKGKKSSQFTVLQDDEQVVDVAQGLAAAPAPSEDKEQSDFDALKEDRQASVKQALDRSAIKRQAATLTANVKNAR